MILTKLSGVVICLVIFFSHFAAGQKPVADLDRPSDYDVQHYVLRISFDETTRTVFGDTSVHLKPVGNELDTIVLDQRSISFESVTLEPSGAKLTFAVKPDRIAVKLDRPYSPSETVVLRFKYSAKPKKGVYFIEEKKDKGSVVNPAQIWTQGEPDEARHWFPSFDFPSDKATTEQIITVGKPKTVIGNGELVSRKENADGTVTYHYRMAIPHPTYLVSFVIGDYVRVDDKFRDIPLGYYVYRGTEPIVPKAYGKTKDMLRIFEEITKVDYPFNKYDQTIVSNFTFGGMENITATTMADTEIFLANFDFMRGAVEDLVAHEIAHSWFGNNVTCKNWAELWLNEGFATFMEAAVRERLYGRADYIRKIGVDAESFMADAAVNSKPMGLYNLTAGNVDALFDRPAVTYNKGGAVIHQLREQVGDEAFWKAVNLYLTRHRFGSVTTPDLQKAMEEVSGQKLGWFFEQWVYGTGHPKLTIRQRFDEARKELVLEIEQTQKGALVPEVFRLPLEIELRFAEEPARIEKLDINARRQTISVPVGSKPASVSFDPASKLPLTMIKAQQ